MNLNLIQITERHLSNLYPEDQLPSVMAAISQETAELRLEATTFRNPVNKGFFADAVAGAAIYRTLLKLREDNALSISQSRANM